MVKSHPHQTCRRGTGVRHRESVYLRRPRCVPLPESRDVLTEILRNGARELLAKAVEAEIADWIDAHAHLKDSLGHRQVVRNGSHPERTILTGLGPIEVKQPRVQDRRPPDLKERFSPSILPPYLRRTRSLDEAIPWLYLKGISSSDFPEALQALFGPDAKGLSANTVTRLKAAWEEEYQTWSKRSLKGQHYVYVWADGVHFNIRLEGEREPDGVLEHGVQADGECIKELASVERIDALEGGDRRYHLCGWSEAIPRRLKFPIHEI